MAKAMNDLAKALTYACHIQQGGLVMGHGWSCRQQSVVVAMKVLRTLSKFRF